MTALTLGVLLAAPAAFAEDVAAGDMCEPLAPEIDRYQHLRALSLDIRGELPTPEEYHALDGVDDIPEALIDEWLQSDAFAQRLVRKHRDLIWNNIDNTPLVNTGGRMAFSASTYWRSGAMARTYRGVASVRCLDEPARFGPGGEILTTTDPEDGSEREGYVWVEPFWAPGTQVKVCAFDAQEAPVSPAGTICASAQGLGDRGCGCGPNLRHCTTSTLDREVTRAMAMDVDLRIADVVRRDQSYLELLTGSKAYFNGPLVHYWKYQRAFPRMVMDPPPIPIERLPDLTWDDDETWVEVDLGPQHAGILTSSAFLLRFQTNRARANRYFNAFLCQPFNAPSGGIPVATEAAQTEPDLQVRHGCEYCHAMLEPAAAHWGRWGERGASYLSPLDHPPFDAECELCATSGLPCSTRCQRSYIVNALDPKEESYLGFMRAYLFRRPAHEVFVEQGPKLLVYGTIVDGRFPRCAAKTAVRHFLGREVHEEEADWIEELANAFVASGYKYRTLVKRVLTHPTYRRVR